MESRRSISIALAVLIWLLICGAAVGGYLYGRSLEDEKAAYKQGQRRAMALVRPAYFRGVRDGAKSVFSRYALKKGAWYTIHLTDAFRSTNTARYIDDVYPIEAGLQYSLCRAGQAPDKSASNSNAKKPHWRVCTRTAPK